MKNANVQYQLHEPAPTKLLNAREVAEILNISRAFAYKLMQTGEIPTIRIGYSRRVRLADVEEFIERNLQPQSSRFGLK